MTNPTRWTHRTPRRVVSILALAAAATLAVAASCRTAPAPPPPPPPPQVEPEAPAPAPAPVMVTVTGTRLNVRQGPSVDTATLAKVKRGEKLTVVAEEGEWLQVSLPGDKTGWVSGRYVKRETPCPPDKPEPEILDGPPFSFSEGATLGKVVIDIAVDAAGTVTATKVTSNTTGDQGLADHALEEAKSFRFAPPVRRCRPVAFTYVYTRNY